MATTAGAIEAARELDELYRRHGAEIFRYAYAVLGNRADAEDVTQTTFVNALRALERGEQPRTPKNWLITIAHNLIRQRFRQQQARPQEVELDRELPAAEAAEDGPSIDDLVRALQRIPPTQRQAIVLRELEDRSYAEICELLDISQSALEALLFRARRSLTEELENLVTCDAAELSLSRAGDGRIGRKERRRLLAHLDECEACARTAARRLKYRRTFKALAVLPLPFSLTLFKGAPTASAAVGLPTIGAAAGTGVAAGTATGVGAKLAVGLAAVALAGGAGYEGVQAVKDEPAPVRAAAMTPNAATPVASRTETTPRTSDATPRPADATAAAAIPATVKPAKAKLAKAAPAKAKQAKAKPDKAKPVHTRPVQAASPERGKSAAAPGRTKPQSRPERTAKPEARTRPVPAAKSRPAKPAKPARAPKIEKPVRAEKPAGAEKPEKAAKPEKPLLTPEPPAADPLGRAKPDKPAG